MFNGTLSPWIHAGWMAFMGFGMICLRQLPRSWIIVKMCLHVRLDEWNPDTLPSQLAIANQPVLKAEYKESNEICHDLIPSNLNELYAKSNKNVSVPIIILIKYFTNTTTNYAVVPYSLQISSLIQVSAFHWLENWHLSFVGFYIAI